MEELLVQWWLNKPNTLPFKINDTGIVNLTDGPDIQGCSLEIDGKVYTGNIEIDVKKSFWFAHGHYQNERYQNTLLHLYKSDDSYLYTEGYVPHFSYCIDRNIVKKNHHIIISKRDRIINLLNHHSHNKQIQDTVDLFVQTTRTQVELAEPSKFQKIV